MAWWIWVLAGVAGGVISGLGIGGGSLLIPVLVLCGDLLKMPWDQKAAQTANLLSFLPAASVALISHFKQHRIDVTAAKRVIPAGVVGACIGALLTVAVQAGFLRKAFGVFLVFMAGYEMFFHKETAK